MSAVAARHLRLVEEVPVAEAPRRSVASNARLALAGDLAGKAAQLAALALAARLLSTQQLALLGVCLALATVVTAVLDMGISTVLVREAAGEPGRAWPLLLGSLRARLALVLLVAGLTVEIGLWLGSPLEGLLVLTSGAVGAALIGLLAVFRAAQQLAVEAEARLAAAVLSLVAVGALATRTPSAAAVLAGLTLGPAFVLPALAARARQPGKAGGWALLRDGAPFGLMALGTLLYYRTPTLILARTRPAADTAAYTLASTVAFGLLAIPNAITTALLPRLSGLGEADEQRALARKALGWTLQLWAVTALVVGILGEPIFAAVFGARYASAAMPLLILLGGGLAIGASGAIGTVLVARRGTSALAVQVGAALALNIALGAVLIPRYGQNGAAVDTLVTELVALALVARAGARSLPGLLGAPQFRALWWVSVGCVALAGGFALGGGARFVGAAAAVASLLAAEPSLVERLPLLKIGVLGGIASLVVGSTWATATSYGLRVISDSPTFLALIRSLAARPFQPASPFLTGQSQGESHASPYTQAIAWIWLKISDNALDPVWLGHVLGLVGIGVMLLVLHAVFVFVRREANSRAAWIAIPVLLLLFGPAHVIWAGDLTFNGFLYGAYFPQTLAVALLLYTLLLTDGAPCWERYVLGSILVAATLVVHPFTGVLLAVLVAVRGSVLAQQRSDRWQVGSLCLVGGFVLGGLWPAYSLDAALGETGVTGRTLIIGCALVPLAARALPRLRFPSLSPLDRPGPLAVLGAVGVAALAAWECFLFTQFPHDPLLHSNHLSLYWVEDRWRWPLMFAAGAVGLAGLVRLAQRGKPLALLWFAGCFAFGVVGAGGMALPLWWRFLLFCQVPLALGTALVLSEAKPGRMRTLVITTFVLVAAFKLVTLTELSPKIRYLDTPLQSSYTLGSVVPPGSGLVAADPFTSYFVPGTTGHRVLVVTKAHVSSQDELNQATAGYALLHSFFQGTAWWTAAQQMWRDGVRYIVIEKSTSLRAPDLVTFSTGPTPLVRTAADRRALGTYFYRSNRVGDLISDGWPYAVYRLDQQRLFG